MTIASSFVISENSDHIQNDGYKEGTIKCLFGGDDPFCSSIITLRKIDENYRNVNLYNTSSSLSSDMDIQFCNMKRYWNQDHHISNYRYHTMTQMDRLPDNFDDENDTIDKNPFLTVNKPLISCFDDFCDKIATLNMMNRVIMNEKIRKMNHKLPLKSISIKKRNESWDDEDISFTNPIFSDFTEYDNSESSNNRGLLNSSSSDFHIQEWIHIEDLPEGPDLEHHGQDGDS